MLDPAKLKRVWWLTPLTMTLWLVFLAVLIGWAIKSNQNPYYVYRNASDPTSVAILVALGLGVVGLLVGLAKSAGARGAVDRAFGTTYLPADHRLAQRVNQLGAKLDLPPVAVGVMKDVNAFAVGSDPTRSAVVLGLPLIKMLDDDELDAVIGHELGHIATRDVHRSLVAEGYQQLFVQLFSLIVVVIIRAAAKKREDVELGRLIEAAGRKTLLFGSELIVKRLSRQREFYADAIGASLTSPLVMVSALEKIHNLEAPPSSAELQFAYLMFRPEAGYLFSTHPSLELRRAALESRQFVDRLVQGHPLLNKAKGLQPVASRLHKDLHNRAVANLAAARSSTDRVRAAFAGRQRAPNRVAKPRPPRPTVSMRAVVGAGLFLFAGVAGVFIANYLFPVPVDRFALAKPMRAWIADGGRILALPQTAVIVRAPDRAVAFLQPLSNQHAQPAFRILHLVPILMGGFKKKPFVVAYDVRNAYGKIASEYRETFDYVAVDDCVVDVHWNVFKKNLIVPPLATESQRILLRFDFRKVSGVNAKVGHAIQEGLLAAIADRLETNPPRKSIHVTFSGRGAYCSFLHGRFEPNCAEQDQSSSIFEIHTPGTTVSDVRQAYEEIRKLGCHP